MRKGTQEEMGNLEWARFIVKELDQKCLECFLDFSLIFEPSLTIYYDGNGDEMNNELLEKY